MKVVAYMHMYTYMHALRKLSFTHAYGRTRTRAHTTDYLLPLMNLSVPAFFGCYEERHRAHVSGHFSMNTLYFSSIYRSITL